MASILSRRALLEQARNLLFALPFTPTGISTILNSTNAEKPGNPSGAGHSIPIVI